ncbi:hypothetical protein NC652_034138 [Populus alba x Populus x berolinensis]|nr:hypothetical protein NC652_034138 [Populus alba x Populus x berolinensis]
MGHLNKALKILKEAKDGGDKLEREMLEKDWKPDMITYKLIDGWPLSKAKRLIWPSTIGVKLHFKGIGLSVLLGIILWIRSEQIVSMTMLWYDLLMNKTWTTNLQGKQPIKSFPLHYVGTTFSESSTRKPLWRTQLIDPKPAIIAPRQYNFSPIKGEEDMEELAIAMPRRPLKLDSSKALASLSLCLPISAMSKIMNREARVSTELLSKTILLFPLA